MSTQQNNTSSIPTGQESNQVNRRQFLSGSLAAFGASWAASWTRIPDLLSATNAPEPARVQAIKASLAPLTAEIEKLQTWYSRFVGLAYLPEGELTARELLETWDHFTVAAEEILGIIQNGELEEQVAAALVGLESYQNAIDNRWPDGWHHCDSAKDGGFELCEEAAVTVVTIATHNGKVGAELRFCGACRALWESSLRAEGVAFTILEERPLRVEA